MAAALRALGFDIYTCAGRVVSWDKIVPGSTKVGLSRLPYVQ